MDPARAKETAHQAGRAIQDQLGEGLSRAQERIAARRFVRELDPALVLAGVVAVGVAVGLTRDPSRTARVTGLAAAGVAGAILYRMTR